MTRPRISRTKRRRDRHRRAEQLRRDLDEIDPEISGSFTMQVALRGMGVAAGEALALTGVTAATINAIVRRKRGARYVFTSRPTLTAVALAIAAYLSGISLGRWTRTHAEQIQRQAESARGHGT